MGLENKVAFITGGARAMGRCFALRLAAEGADVALAAPEADELQNTAAEIEKLGRRAVAVVTDVSHEDQIDAAVSQTHDVLGPIDILINNAGIIGPTALVPQVSRQEWDEVLAVNLTGAFLCAKAVAPGMIGRQSGKIVNISSIAGLIGYAYRSPYAVSKWGLIGLTKTLAKELGPYNVQVNAVCPGPVEGERMKQVIERRARESKKSIDQVRAEYLDSSALGRMVRADDIAAMVSFLVSDQADNITGEAIEVSAGYGL